MASAITSLWIKKLESEEKFWKEVPERRKADIKEQLVQDVENGRRTVEFYKKITGEDYNK